MPTLLSKRQQYTYVTSSSNDITTNTTSCIDNFGNSYPCNGYSSWDYWGRWVFLGVAIFLIFLVCISISCLSARRRRRMGRQPYYGTGWAANHGPWAGNYPPQNNPNTYYAHQQPAPPYEQQSPYREQPPYREQQSGIELSPPANTYGGDYAPPYGPPPKKY
jgi:Chitin synthesis regulation, resistance to Congo red